MSLGIANVDAMILKGLTAKQFDEWMYYASLEPFGSFRDDYRLAHIAQMIHNCAVAKKDQKPLKDFLLHFDQELEREEVVVSKPEEKVKTVADEGAQLLLKHQAFLNLVGAMMTGNETVN